MFFKQITNLGMIGAFVSIMFVPATFAGVLRMNQWTFLASTGLIVLGVVLRSLHYAELRKSQEPKT